MPIPNGKESAGVFKVARNKINNKKIIKINSSQNFPDTL